MQKLSWAGTNWKHRSIWHGCTISTILAMWFITQTKIEWAEQYARDPGLLQQFEVEVLPALSTANVSTACCHAVATANA